MKWAKHVMAWLSPLFLAACFVSASPLIPPGDGIKFDAEAIMLCGDGECSFAQPLGDGYEMPDEDASTALQRPKSYVFRFATLWDSPEGTRVYLAEMGSERGDDVMYFVARQLPDSLSRFELQMPDCRTLNDAELAQFALARVDQYSCSAPDLASLKAVLLYLYEDDFPRDDFWRE